MVLLCLELPHRVRAGAQEDGSWPSKMAGGSEHHMKGFGPRATHSRGDPKFVAGLVWIRLVLWDNNTRVPA